MEKTVVLLPIIIFGVFFLLLIIGFFGLVAKLLLNAKKDEWIGTVVDKTHKTMRNDNDIEEDYYSLVINTDAGKQRKIAVALAQYNEAKPGDRYQKIKGNFIPKKI